MPLVLASEPELFLNIDKDLLNERYEFNITSTDILFKLGNEPINFDSFIVEIFRQNGTTEIKHILIGFPKVPQEKLLKIASFFNLSPEDRESITSLSSENLIFSIIPEKIEAFIQPNYNSPQDSEKIFEYLDDSGYPLLLNFDNYSANKDYQV